MLSSIASQPTRFKITILLWILSGHLAIWMLFLGLYPFWPQVQALFIWNKRVRQWFGLFYVQFLFLYVPLFRKRLLLPFRDSLLSGATHGEKAGFAYFDGIRVDIDGEVKLLSSPLLWHSRLWLEGESGSGKTTVLMRAACSCPSVAIYLRARDCENGVVSAICKKLPAQLGDEEFLEALVFNGALEIYIDSLNEAARPTTLEIREFANRNPHCKVVIASQPGYDPPKNVRIGRILPLEEKEIAAFLATRPPGSDAEVTAEQYESLCARTAGKLIASFEELPGFAGQISNPMDLTTVAEMLWRGIEPDPFKLRQQQYEVMAGEYKSTYLHEFPLAPLADAAYKTKVQGSDVIVDGLEGGVLELLAKHKLITRRGTESSDEAEIRFRHEKILDFFVAKHFVLNVDLQRKHLLDRRFAGVYWLLAFIMPLDEATELRNLAVEMAAERGEHIVADKFVTASMIRRRRLKLGRAATT